MFLTILGFFAGIIGGMGMDDFMKIVSLAPEVL